MITGAALQAGSIASLVRAKGIDIDDSPRRRSEYSSDASNYRVTPRAVVFPRHVDEVVTVLELCRAEGIPVTSRGGGTSVAGNAIGEGVVIDYSRHLNRVAVQSDAATARVEPGLVLADLQRAAAPMGLRFGPDPSTASRCTIGGMIGNNACGPRALAYGRTADNVVSLDVVDGLGRRFEAANDLSAVPGLEGLVSGGLATIRTELGRFGRQISGYSLEHLLPEHGSSLARTLVGSEGTCVAVLGAEIRLVPVAPAPVLVVLGYPDMASAAEAVPALLSFRPIAMEALDGRIVDALLRRGGSVPRELPRGNGWLFIELGGASLPEALDQAGRLVATADALDSLVLPPGPEARALWRIREDGAGLAGRTADGRQAWPGIEDAAVPPERLAGYLRQFEALLASYGLDGMPYGHFGDGCVHVRVDFPLDHDARVFREVMEAAADLVVAHGGSLSGEHGDGRARSELLQRMYSEDALSLFSQFKGLMDPQGLMNPGVMVDPKPLDADLRRPQALPVRAMGFAFAHDGGDLTAAVNRCVGVGKCRADLSASGGFMCPSYQATLDEKDSTRGRARVLQDAIIAGLGVGDRQSKAVEESLDLCLSCKACASDCPAGVDMAAMKSEYLHRRYRRRLRPINHYTLGWMPRWARAAGLAPGLINRVISVRPLERLALWAGGMDTRRSIPRFARPPFRRWWAKRPSSRLFGPHEAFLWVDTFSDCFSSEIATAAVTLLEGAGIRVHSSTQSACCGLTWISTGQLDGARRRLSDLLDRLGPIAEQGLPIVGLEPSCTAVLRSDLLELLPEDPRSKTVSAAVRTLSEYLLELEADGTDLSGLIPDLAGQTIVVQPHCHQYSVMGFEADLALLRRTGAEVRVASGCCGLAGNFGMERGHFEISQAVAENALLPALAQAPDGAIYVADGLSCRTQADQLAGVSGVHLAQILAG